MGPVPDDISWGARGLAGVAALVMLAGVVIGFRYGPTSASSGVTPRPGPVVSALATPTPVAVPPGGIALAPASVRYRLLQQYQTSAPPLMIYQPITGYTGTNADWDAACGSTFDATLYPDPISVIYATTVDRGHEVAVVSSLSGPPAAFEAPLGSPTGATTWCMDGSPYVQVNPPQTATPTP